MDHEIVVDCRCELGEGPLWNAVEQRLYWTDILGGRIDAFSPATGESTSVYEGDLVSGFTFQDGGGLILFGARGSVRLLVNSEITTLIAQIDAEHQTRFNDVIADPAGRVFAATMPPPNGRASMYRLDTDGHVTRVESNIGLGNGFAFSPDRKVMYFTDSGGGDRPACIYAYAYDSSTGELSGRCAVHRPQEADGIPDGLTVDRDGCLWSARWGAGCVIRLSPDGEEIGRVKLPAQKITAVAFGGAELDELYITSAGGEDRSLADNGPAAGALFRVRPGVCGLPEFQSRVRLR